MAGILSGVSLFVYLEKRTLERNYTQQGGDDKRDDAQRPDKFQRVFDVVTDADIRKAKADIESRCPRRARW